MKPFAIFAIGLLLLVLVFSIVTYVQDAVLFLAVMTVVFLAGGAIAHMLGPKQFSIRLPPPDNSTEDVPTLIIQGTPFQPTASTIIDGQLRLGNLPILVGTLLSALAVSYVVLSTTDLHRQIDNSSSLYFVFYFLAYFSALPLFISGRFLLECGLLSRAALTIGFVQQHFSSAFHGRQIRFEFRDLSGSYFGDTAMNRSGTSEDSVVLVFFRPDKPEQNRAAPSLLFHDLRISVK